MSIETIKEYYKDKINSEDPDYRIHGWESEEAHLRRFNVLYDEVKLKGKSLLDVGCGVGTLFPFLRDRRVKVSYVGVDVLREMINIARERYSDALFMNLNIFEENPFPASSFNIVYASGIFNIEIGNNEQFLQEALSLFGDLAMDQIVFNLLSVNSENKEPGYYYVDPENIIHIIRKSGIRYREYRIIQNYLKNDFTVIIDLEPKEEKYLKYEAYDFRQKSRQDKKKMKHKRKKS